MRPWVLALALFHPEDVDHIDAFIGADNSVNLSWTLPSDPTVVGLTIYRDNLDNGDTTIFQIVGLTTSFVDTGADPDDDYRYWIHTRDAQGDLSAGVFVEVFEDHDHGDGHWSCSSGSVSGAGLSPALLALAAGLGLVALRRR
jgi:MYXO-CTERM domain-containing protein